MPEPLSVDADGLRRASSRSDELANQLSVSGGASSAGGSQPTAAAVQVVHGLVAKVRADQSAFLAGRSGVLRAGADDYARTDDSSAGRFREIM